MNNHANIPEVEPDMSSRGSLSVYQSDTAEEFPVLKAFQQYIDSEQSKARKRMIGLSVFFVCMMVVVISVFVVILLRVSDRNQLLNDRLVEYAMKERDRVQVPAPVVVQPQQPAQDNTAVLKLTEKLAEMQKQLSDQQAKAAKAAEAAAKAAEEAAAAKAKAARGPSPEEQEIAKLKEQLKAAKEVAAAEKAKKREAELEAYRRQHYPELYAPQPKVTPKKTVNRQPVKVEIEDDELDDDSAITYFDDDDEDEAPRRPAKRTTKKTTRKAVKPAAEKPAVEKPAATKPVVEKPVVEKTKPAAVQTTSGGWEIPED